MPAKPKSIFIALVLAAMLACLTACDPYAVSMGAITHKLKPSKEGKCCWRIERFSNAQSYEASKRRWQSRRPDFPGPYDATCGLRWGYYYSHRVNDNWDSKYKHCWVGCMVENHCNQETIDYMGWQKEYWDLTDCDKETQFSEADYAATLSGSHKGKVDCDRHCR